MLFLYSNPLNLSTSICKINFSGCDTLGHPLKGDGNGITEGRRGKGWEGRGGGEGRGCHGPNQVWEEIDANGSQASNTSSYRTNVCSV